MDKRDFLVCLSVYGSSSLKAATTAITAADASASISAAGTTPSTSASGTGTSAKSAAVGERARGLWVLFCLLAFFLGV